MKRFADQAPAARPNPFERAAGAVPPERNAVPDDATPGQQPRLVPYSSVPYTLAHSRRVGVKMAEVICDLAGRSVRHDLSKTEPPEVAYFDIGQPRLNDPAYAYGTPAYFASLEELKPGMDHHYEVNDHHPEHFPDGINGMNLMQLVELLADWSDRAGGNLRHSIIEINMKRFGITPQLAQILINTAVALGWISADGRNAIDPAGE